MSLPQPRLPVADLGFYLGEPTALGIARGCRKPERTVQRWKAEGGIPFRTAEQLAAALGEHPAVIWPGWSAMSADRAAKVRS